jgi:hypothetical protein
MMWRFAVLIVLVASTASAQSAPSTTSPSTSPATAPNVEALIQRLSGEHWKDRQRAQDDLVQLGASVRARLQELVRETHNDEVRTRAGAAIEQIDEIQQTGTSMITLHLHSAEPREIFAELARQAHAPIEPAQPQFWENAHLAKTSIDIDHVPFWTAMTQVAAATGLDLVQFNDQMKLVQTGGAPARGPWTVSGPFLVVANFVSRSESIDLSQMHGPAGNALHTEQDFSVQFTATAEPKLRVLQASSAARIDQAIDDRGNSLLPPDAPPEGSAGYAVNIVGNWSFAARLNYPDRDRQPGTRISRLKGSVSAIVRTRSESIQIKDILTAKNVDRTAGGTRYSFKGITRNERQYQVSISAQLDPTRADDATRIQSVLSSDDVRLEDSAGHAWLVVGRNISNGNNSLDATIDFSSENMPQPPGEPSKLVLLIPTETRELIVPFEFSNLPIP